MNVFYVYAHMKPDLTPFYVGKGSLNRALDLKPKGRNSWHQNIVRKYGEENIIVETKMCRSENEAFFCEEQTIKTLRDNGIVLSNLTNGGEGNSGYKHREESKQKMSVSKKGKKLSEIHRINLSKAKSGRTYTEAERLAKLGKNNCRFGKKLSESHRLIISIANKNRKKHPMSDATKQKISQSKVGTKNSKEACEKMRQYRWMVKLDSKAMKVHINNIESFLANGWLLGKKFKTPS